MSFIAFSPFSLYNFFLSIYLNLFLIALSESVYGLMPGSGYQEQIWLNGRWLEGYFIPQPSWLD